MSRKKNNRQAGSPQTGATDAVRTNDSFANFGARVGWGTDNQSSGSSYQLSYQSRNRVWLEAAYRGSWIVGKMVDCPAEDMTRAGIEFQGMQPDDVEAIDDEMTKLAIWEKLADNIKWARLYGGSIAVMLIDGQDMASPLRPETVGQGQFKGLFVLDRWMVTPSVTELIKEFGPHMGLPEFYQVTSGTTALGGAKIHYSRVIRMEGGDLPHYQRISENYWGISVLEQAWDRLIAYDSTSVGAAQLVYKAHLRTIKIKDLRQIIAMGGPGLTALVSQMDFIRSSQTNEGLTLIDGEDDFDVKQYSFSGLSDMLVQFGQQLSGATGIPMTRLFGQSPAGLASTGDGEMKQYHEHINSMQERRMRNPLRTLLQVMSMSRLGKPLDDGFGFTFRSLQRMSEGEKADVAQKTTQTVIEAVDSGLIDLATGMKELKAQSHTTGIFSNISDDAIESAELMPPPSAGELEPPNADPGQAADPIAAIAAGAPQPEGAGAGQAGRALLRLAASAGRDSGWALGQWLSSRKSGRAADH